jgi:hypothetical protein
MIQFTFLQREWAAVPEAACKGEAAVHADPRTAWFYAVQIASVTTAPTPPKAATSMRPGRARAGGGGGAVAGACARRRDASP